MALMAVLALGAAPATAKDNSGGGEGAGSGNGGQKQQKPQQKHQQHREQQPQPQQREQQQQKHNAEHNRKRGDGEASAGKENSSARTEDAGKDSNDKSRARKRDKADGDGAHETDGPAAKQADAAEAQGDRRNDDDKGRKDEHPRHESVNQREQNQARRLHNGVKHGQLTSDEIAKLDAQEKALADAEANFKSDGKLTRDESRQLQRQLNEASEQIWAQRHDTEGNQRSVVLLGKDVIARDELTRRMESGELTGPEARKFAADFRRMIGMKKRLSNDDLSDDDRAKLQGEYDGLLDTYFQLNEDKQSNEK
jgi:hypothetical protein